MCSGHLSSSHGADVDAVPLFTSSELSMALASLNQLSSPGLDGIPVSTYTQLGEAIFPKFIYFPKEWELARVKVIRKSNKDDYESLGSFRPISVVKSLGKIFEEMVLGRLKWLSMAGSQIKSSQRGFVGSRSTETAALSLATSVEKGFQKGRSTTTLFIDIRAAFDSAWSPAILAALLARSQNPFSLLLPPSTTFNQLIFHIT